MQSTLQPLEAADEAARPSAEQVIADFPSWDLPSDLDNWFLVLDAIDNAQTPRLRTTAAIVRFHLMRAVSELKILERQRTDPDCLALDDVAF